MNESTISTRTIILCIMSIILKNKYFYDSFTFRGVISQKIEKLSFLWLYFWFCRDIICVLRYKKHCFYFAAVAILTTVIFQQIAHKPTKFKKEFAAYIGEMYPVGLCLHILSDASLHVCKWFLVGPVSECLGAFVFF